MEIQGMNAEEQIIVNKLLDIMKEQNMKEQARSMEEVTRYIVGMQVQLSMVTNELHGIKEQLNQMQNPQPASAKIKDSVTKSVQQFEEKINRLSDKVSDTKTHLAETASKAVSAFKEKGKQAMNKVLQSGISGIRNRLQDAKVSLADTIAAYANTAGRINSVGNEMKQVGNSVANIGRLLSGKDARAMEISEKKPGVMLTRAINKPIINAVTNKNESMRKIDNVLAQLDKISNSLNASLGTPKKEEKTGDRKENRESIKDKLSQMKEKTEQQKEQTEPQKEKKQEACL